MVYNKIIQFGSSLFTPPDNWNERNIIYFCGRLAQLTEVRYEYLDANLPNRYNDEPYQNIIAYFTDQFSDGVKVTRSSIQIHSCFNDALEFKQRLKVEREADEAHKEQYRANVTKF